MRKDQSLDNAVNGRLKRVVAGNQRCSGLALNDEMVRVASGGQRGNILIDERIDAAALLQVQLQASCLRPGVGLHHHADGHVDAAGVRMPA
jgi:hypothetical protein